MDSPGTGAFLADMKVGVPSKGLSVSDRINDALHESDQVLARAYCAAYVFVCACVSKCVCVCAWQQQLLSGCVSRAIFFSKADASRSEHFAQFSQQQPLISLQRQPRLRSPG